MMIPVKGIIIFFMKNTCGNKIKKRRQLRYGSRPLSQWLKRATITPMTIGASR
ncbi:hypothetical protein RV02_GL002895 [Enterococcus gilvus]|jgi:hypothetical protein|nr:hypothetical protein [Enterococcus sp.]MDN6584116.1 hypothetical protein [Enterococcus sp.]MDN6649602.1 hypothetical protein [Enterococcus sp.]OJG38473.1 hypothetical protein RV02_GL002895 [Enterococcus gilvus]